MLKVNKINLVFCAWPFCFMLEAQVNLVINPSFETHSICPTNTGGDVDKAIGWDTCRATADYFHSCGTNTLFQSPLNYFGFQYPAHGNAYSGFYTYDGSLFYREIIVGQLSMSLTTSQKYYISLKVNRADANFVVGYSTNKMGIKFSKVKQNYVSINNLAHFYSNTVITDTVNWTKLFGSFVADSAYKYLMIGNFFDNANTTIINHGNGNIAYYYVDEVCVSTDSAFTKNYVTVGIPELQNKNELIIYPNPTSSFINIKCNGIIESVFLIDVTGDQHQLFIEKNNKELKIDLGNYPAGIYYLKIFTNNAVNYEKLILNQ